MRFTTEKFGPGDTSWLGNGHALRDSLTGTVVVSDFTKDTHYKDGYLPSGLPVNRANLAALKPYTGGAGEVLGFITFDQSVHPGATTLAVPVMAHGTIRTKRLPVTLPSAALADAHFVFNTGADV